MKGVGVAVFAFSFASCVGFEVSGGDQILASDIRQIKRLVENRRDILKPIISLDVIRADEARVTSGRNSNVGDKSDEFGIKKRKGLWLVSTRIEEIQVLSYAMQEGVPELR